MSKKALVIGLKKSGLAAINILEKQGYEVVVTINNSLNEEEREQLKDIRVYENNHPLELLDEDFEFIVKNPGIPYYIPFIQEAIARKFKIYSEIELAYLYSDNTYLAITGTNGKTTTTTLIYNIFKEVYDNVILAGNIGIPLSKTVMEKQDNNLVILELSSFQLMGIDKFKPHIATILNLSPDHLDYMKNLDDYYKSKLLIYKNQDENDYFIYNEDDENIKKYVQNLKAKVIKFSIKKESDVYLKDNWIYYNNEPIIDTTKIQVEGNHSLQNIMVALIYAKLYNINDDIIRKVVYEFKGVRFRFEKVCGFNNNTYYNDSKSTTVQSTITAIEALSNQDSVLILGGFDKGLDYQPLIEKINNSKQIKKVLTYGMIKNEFNKVSKELKKFENLEEVVKYLKENIYDKTVLFSPATSSFDQYENYEKRGEAFDKLIRG